MTIALIGLALCILIIAFLIFQLHAMGVLQRDASTQDQDCVVLIARQLVKSATQSHPLFALEHAAKATYMLEDLERRHGSISQAERRLKIPNGKLLHLQTKVKKQYRGIQAAVVQALTVIEPRLDTPLNVDAGFTSAQEEIGELP